MFTKSDLVHGKISFMKGKVVLITGSSIGIGAQTALKFSEEGCKVVVTYFKDKREAEEIGEKCKSLGAKDVLVLPLNVTDDQSIKDCVKKVIEKYGQIDILVNNAGVNVWSDLKNQSFEEIEQQLRTNLEGLIKVTRECLNYIKETIINISSIQGMISREKESVYSASKWGVRGFTKSLALELSNIKVYSVNPRGTATRMADFGGQPPEEVAEIILNTAKGTYNLPSGSDVNVWEVS